VEEGIAEFVDMNSYVTAAVEGSTEDERCRRFYRRKRAIVAGFLSNPSSGTLGPCEGISGWKRGRERPATGIGRHDNARELEVTWTIGRPIWSRRVGLARNVDRSASVVSVWRAESSRTNVNNAAEVKFVNKVMWIVVRPEK
jgi:hypothetical protein